MTKEQTPQDANEATIGAVALDRRVRALAPERVAYGEAGAIPFVDETTTGDMFENAIRRFGVVAACEWFGHTPDSEFTAETIRVLQERSNAALRGDSGLIAGVPLDGWVGLWRPGKD